MQHEAVGHRIAHGLDAAELLKRRPEPGGGVIDHGIAAPGLAARLGEEPAAIDREVDAAGGAERHLGHIRQHGKGQGGERQRQDKRRGHTAHGGPSVRGLHGGLA